MELQIKYALLSVVYGTSDHVVELTTEISEDNKPKGFDSHEDATKYMKETKGPGAWVVLPVYFKKE